jgi:hypothetical protein
MAPRMTPEAAMAAKTGPTWARSQSPPEVQWYDQRSRLAEKVPVMTRNSPMKPLVPGSPMLLIVTSTNIVAYQGITLAMPPNSATSRVCRRS